MTAQRQSQAEKLNDVLRGEISAVETYGQALARIERLDERQRLQQIQDEHKEVVGRLASVVHRLGGEPVHSSGAWGSFAKAVESTASILGSSSAIKALKQGEEHGRKHYERVLSDPEVDGDLRSLLEGCARRQQEHIRTLDVMLDAQ